MLLRDRLVSCREGVKWSYLLNIAGTGSRGLLKNLKKIEKLILFIKIQCCKLVFCRLDSIAEVVMETLKTLSAGNPTEKVTGERNEEHDTGHDEEESSNFDSCKNICQLCVV